MRAGQYRGAGAQRDPALPSRPGRDRYDHAWTRGLEFLKDAQALYPELPVLVVSMHDEMLHAERTLRAGARGYLMKEAGGEKLLEAIRKVLSGQVYVSERMAAKIFDIFSGRRSSGRSPIEQLTDQPEHYFRVVRASALCDGSKLPCGRPLGASDDVSTFTACSAVKIGRRFPLEAFPELQ